LSVLRKYSVLVFLLIGSVVFAQYNVVHYKYIAKTPMYPDYIKDSFLLFNQDKQYFLKPYTKDYKNYAALQEDKSYYAVKKSNMTSLMRNIGEERYYGIGFAGQFWEIYYDDVPKIDWHITEEHKDIMGYTTTKATAEFRGRKYTAWFSMEMPYSVGPWKFSGLPGLILEVYDEDYMFNFIAQEIQMTNDVPIFPKFKYYEDHKNDMISYKAFIEKENGYKISSLQQTYANSSSGNTLSARDLERMRDFDMEKTFEWEKNKKIDTSSLKK